MIRPHPLTIFSFLAVLTAFGCGTDRRTVTGPELSASMEVADHRSVDPASSRGRHFYPLEIGNRWSYKGSYSTLYRSWDGESTEAIGIFTRRNVLTRTDLAGEREYIREDRETIGSAVTIHSARWLRQDATGLYETMAPSRDESRLLAHPLHVGATWVFNQTQHQATATVEARELITTPAGRFPAWRVRIHYVRIAGEEQQIVWYGDAGYLGGRYDFRLESLDGQGRAFVVASHEEEWLESLNLVNGTGRTISGRTFRRSTGPRESPR